MRPKSACLWSLASFFSKRRGTTSLIPLPYFRWRTSTHPTLWNGECSGQEIKDLLLTRIIKFYTLLPVLIFRQQAIQMPIRTTKLLFEFQEYRKCFTWNNNPDQAVWSEDEQLAFIDQVVRNADANGFLPVVFPPITLQTLPSSNTQTYNPQRFEVLENVHCIKTLQNFLSSKLPVPLSLRDCPIFKNHDQSIQYSKCCKGKEMLGQFSLLSDELKQRIWQIEYPVEIIKDAGEVPVPCH